MVDSLFLNNFNTNYFGMGMNSFNFNNPFTSNFSMPMQFPSMNYNSLFSGNFNSNFNSAMPMFPMGNSNFFANSLFNMPMFNVFNNRFKTNTFKTDFDTKTDLPALKNVYNPEISNKLAKIASETASKKNTIGLCYGGVKDSLLKAGLTKTRLGEDHAYLAKGILKNYKNFKEIDVAKEDLKKLPAGCVIVWQPYWGKDKENKDIFHKDGHIAITLGNGREASDHEQGLLIGKRYSVFVPVGIDKAA